MHNIYPYILGPTLAHVSGQREEGREDEPVPDPHGDVRQSLKETIFWQIFFSYETK